MAQLAREEAGEEGGVEETEVIARLTRQEE